MSLRIFNTRSNSVEPFSLPEDGTMCSIYTCGPTVYAVPHIGNLKTFFWSDFVVGLLDHLYPGQVSAIMNITDVDDKILNKLEEPTLEAMLKMTRYYTDCFKSDLASLAITRYHDNMHTVTDNMESIYELIQSLMDKGFAYQTSDGNIYFDSSKVEEYPFPRFRKETITSDYESDRVILRSSEIRDPKDFVLWKCRDEAFDQHGSKAECIYWNAPFCRGRPGWHTECSAISSRHLDNVWVHMGGEDLCFPHHTCEILQSESHDPSKIFGKYWIHMGFLNLDGDKMSKSIGNILRLEHIPDNRYLLRWYWFTKSYRRTFDFTLEEMRSHTQAFLNFHLLYNKLRLGIVQYPEVVNDVYSPEIFDHLMTFVLDDLDTPRAILELNKWIQRWLHKGMTPITSETILSEMEKINRLFKILDPELLEIPEEILERVREREVYRRKKEFETSDRIRNELSGYRLEDDPFGVSVIRKIFS